MINPTHPFELTADFKPTGDQPEAISALYSNIEKGEHEQVLLGVTGSGKTYTIANVIQKIQRPTLIISHNKTLAAQLYQEFRDFFPNNAVSYYVSYYDYYQPEAYIPHTDTFIEKETQINDEIDKLRLAATTNILTRNDTIVVASVSCIYNIGSPKEYGNFVLELKTGVHLSRESIFARLIQMQYERNDFGFHRSTFRVRGDSIDVFPAYKDTSIRIVMEGSLVRELTEIDPLTGKTLSEMPGTVIYPAKHFMTDPKEHREVFKEIEKDRDDQVKKFKKQNKLIEAQRIQQRVTYDLEMIAEMGYVNGIENYSRYFDGRKPGDPPFTLMDYFTSAAGNDWLMVIDESHMSVPQIRGMYNGDRSRKQTLIDYGFRLPSALDNRPMRSEEFERVQPTTIYVSATPADYELSRGKVVEQLVRPTGLVDPIVDVRPIKGQIEDLHKEIELRVARQERVLVTTLTKQMAEDLTDYLVQHSIKVQYLHSDVETLERTERLADLRRGMYDVVVGVNLLREGLDLPEVSLVAILDADKEGFLRSRTSLVQTMGRAARHQDGMAILYADRQTDSIKFAISEVTRRREFQLAYNATHGITPTSIQKPIRDRLTDHDPGEEVPETLVSDLLGVDQEHVDGMTPSDKKKFVETLTREMKTAGRDLDFELAAQIRDYIAKITK